MLVNDVIAIVKLIGLAPFISSVNGNLLNKLSVTAPPDFVPVATKPLSTTIPPLIAVAATSFSVMLLSSTLENDAPVSVPPYIISKKAIKVFQNGLKKAADELGTPITDIGTPPSKQPEEKGIDSPQKADIKAVIPQSVKLTNPVSPGGPPPEPEMPLGGSTGPLTNL